MKRIVAVLLAVVVLFAFTGCGEEKITIENIPDNALYHYSLGKVIYPGMTEDEIDAEIGEYGKRSDGSAIIYDLGELTIAFTEGIVQGISTESDEWVMKGKIAVGTSTRDDVIAAYGDPFEEAENTVMENTKRMMYPASDTDEYQDLRILNYSIEDERVVHITLMRIPK